LSVALEVVIFVAALVVTVNIIGVALPQAAAISGKTAVKTSKIVNLHLRITKPLF